MDLGLGREIFVSSEESSFPQAGAASLSQWLWRDLREKLSAFFLFFFLVLKYIFFRFFSSQVFPQQPWDLAWQGCFLARGEAGRW